MFDQETWLFINTFAPWLSALATFSAVLVSLYLATKDRRVTLKVSAGVRILVSPQTKLECADVSVVNIGRREVTVKSIGWQFGLFRTTSIFQLPSGNPLSSQLPIRLLDGGEASFYFPLDAGSHWMKSMTTHLGKRPWINAATMKVIILTSTGKTFKSRIEPGLRRRLAGQKSETVLAD